MPEDPCNRVPTASPYNPCYEKSARLLNNACSFLLDASVLLYFSFYRQPEPLRSTALVLPSGHLTFLRLGDGQAD